MKKILLSLLIVFTTQLVLPLIYAQNIRCEKVDFNRPTSVVNEFGECPGESANVLKINSYAATTIEPFRPTSEFHLSATDQGLSCLQSTSTFTLDIYSEIRTAIFLSWETPGAWVKVQIFDIDGQQIDVVADLEESDVWIDYYGKVNRSIENAHIEILTNMNINSVMALEYVYVLNSNVMDEQCVDEDTEPPVTTQQPPEEPTDDPTDEPTEESTDESTDEPTEESTDETTEESTDDPTDEPTEESTDETTEESTDEPTDESSTDDPTDNPTNSPTDELTDETEDGGSTTTVSPSQSQSTVYIWMTLSVLFLATTVIALVGVFYFICLYRKVASTQPVTSENAEMQTNLPRLQVKNSVNDGDHVIVGIDKV